MGAAENSEVVSERIMDNTEVDPNVKDENEVDVRIKSYGDGESWSRGKMLGEGAYGAVFLATCNGKNSLENLMAVKSCENRYDAESLRHEKSVLTGLAGCSSIVQCFGSEITRKSDGSKVYNLLLEYCSGGALSDKIEDSVLSELVALPEPEVRWYTRSIVEGLVKIHKTGFVHGDIKPDNVLLFSTMNQKEQEFQFLAKIADFGTAKGVREDRQKRKADRYWAGTPWYLAPEAFVELMQEPPSDIWSLRIMVLDMLTESLAWDLKHLCYCPEEVECRCSEMQEYEITHKLEKGACLPKIPNHLSPMAKSFIHSCLRRKKNRATAKKLLRHPFIAGIQVTPSSTHQISPKVGNASSKSRIPSKDKIIGRSMHWYCKAGSLPKIQWRRDSIRVRRRI